jgi:hypothetical protein
VTTLPITIHITIKDQIKASTQKQISNLSTPTSNYYQNNAKEKLYTTTSNEKPIANDYWGSSMDTNDPNCFRVFFQNINGLIAGKSMERWIETVTTMKEKHCKIFGLAETNTNWHSHNIKNNKNRIINIQFSNASTILSSNRYNPTNHVYQGEHFKRALVIGKVGVLK